MVAKYSAADHVWIGEQRPGILNPAANLGQIFCNLLSHSPSRVIQINADTDYHMTCAEMRLRVVRIALNLKKLGLQKGDHVTLACANTDNTVPVFVACLTNGMPVNPLAPVFNKSDFAYMLKQTQPKVVFCDEDNRSVVEAAVQEVFKISPKIFVLGQAENEEESVDFLLQPIEGELDFVPEYFGNSVELLAMVLCSSGTTGLPKGVCLSHAHLIEWEVFSNELNAGPIFSFSALFWATSLLGALTSLYCLRPRVITAQLFDEKLLVSIIEKYRVHDVFTPPCYLSALINSPYFEQADFRSVKRWTLSGSMVSESIRVKLEKRLSNGCAQSVYGTSEIGFITKAYGPYKSDSVGQMVSNIVAKIVDEDGNRLGPCKVGEMRFRYKHTFLGYFNNPLATREAFDEDGFFKSGDVGYFDEDGFLYVVDRIKDVIKYCNYQISPSELEVAIQSIEGVLKVCVVGVPLLDESSDLPTAVVVKKSDSDLTEDRIMAIIDGQVSDYKRLRGGVFFVNQLPMSASGKVLRRKVKEALQNLNTVAT
ncbi:probable 4-coumarate--CoA ligase 3 [Uranotaenia lowii]|uniref:probable 4-coumarate--CoA ligase 3 n=1 Tax=Uranotaenia lowii TaxID=190385 RepID=UPI002478B78F|nr:probable 4-coumarate--CoA ligase 3 [Uranotaenia lowii]